MQTLAIFVMLLLVVSATAGEAAPSNSTQSLEKSNGTATIAPGPPGGLDERTETPSSGGGNKDRKKKEPELDGEVGHDGPNPAATNEEAVDAGSEEATSMTSGGRLVEGIFGTLMALAYLF